MTVSPQVADPPVKPCPCCGEQNTAFLGSVTGNPGPGQPGEKADGGKPPPASDFGFAPGGRLFRCPRCHLLFLEKPPQEDLGGLYAELPGDYLDEIPARRDFDLALAEIRDSPSTAKVLDIGCYRGDFLALLPSTMRKFGIEPSRAGCRVAEKRGIKIVGDTLDTAVVEEGAFDLIFLMDVAEHLPDPFAGLNKISSWLAPGGRLIVTTGNSDALLWRLSRLSYWYYHPQHVSFCNGPWFRWVAKQLNLEITASSKFSHSRRAYGKWFVAERWRQFGKSLLLWSLARCGCPSKRFVAKGDSTWPDHLFVVLRAPPKNRDGSKEGDHDA
jgi:SAM-dependent methyltransferase